MRLLKFPSHSVGSPATLGATSCQILYGRIQVALGQMLNRLGVPGVIREATIQDELTGQHIQIQAGVLFTRVSVNGRDYYFHRLTGKFDGTGMGCS
jgi:hypothetical protein